MRVRRQHKAPTAMTSLTENPVPGVYRLKFFPNGCSISFKWPTGPFEKQVRAADRARVFYLQFQYPTVNKLNAAGPPR